MIHPADYGERWAEVYDSRNPIDDYAEAAADFLSDLAGGGRALEFGVGTGRVAVPLASRGTAVHGIDISESMLAKLRSRPGGGTVSVTLGDMARDRVPGPFRIVYLAFNTLFVLLQQPDQLRCVRNAALHLEPPDGVLVVEAFVPEFHRYSGGQALRAEHVKNDEVWLLASEHDPVAQTIMTQSIRITSGMAELRPVALRYVWPSELDLMCQLAGFRLRERFGGWWREPFTAQSSHHVSVYQLDRTTSSSGGGDQDRVAGPA